jgi:hypothetical protein
MPDRPGVVVATLAASQAPLEFLASWGDMLQYDAAGPGYILPPGGTMKMTSGPRIAEARSQLVDTYFEEEAFKGAEWLLMIDSDMVFKPTLVDQLMEVADPQHVPILGGLCFAGGRDHDPYPTIYREVHTIGDDGKPFVAIQPYREYPRDSLVKVGGTGAACLLVHRQVFIAMAHPHPKGFGTKPDGSKNPYPWFVEGLVAPNGEPIGEDIAFCRRATGLGIPIHVHTGIKLGHMKQYTLDEAWFDASRGAREDAEAKLVVEQESLPEAKPNRAARRDAARKKLKQEVPA